MSVRHALAVIITCLAFLAAPAQTNVADSLAALLPEAPTASDSLKILTDLFDAYPRGENRIRVGNLAVDVALRSGLHAEGLDALRNLANSRTHDTEALRAYRRRAMQFPPSADRDATVCFINIIKNSSIMKEASPRDRARTINTLIKQATDDQEDNIYDRIVALHAISVNLPDGADFTRKEAYLAQLENLIDSLPPEVYYLRNCFLVQAAMAYSGYNYHDARGVRYDEQLLRLIDKMDSGKLGVRRRYRNYDANRFLCHSRILAHYDSLDTEKVDYHYKAILTLMKRDPTTAVKCNKTLRPHIYHAMKHGNYAAALPLLQKAVDLPDNANELPQILDMTIECAQETGDKDALIAAALDRIELAESNLFDRSSQTRQELEVVYDMGRMKDEYSTEIAKVRASQLRWSRGLVVLLLLLIIVVGAMLWRARLLASKLRSANQDLLAERSALKQAKLEVDAARDRAQLANRTKVAFIKNISNEIAVPLHTIREYTEILLSDIDLTSRPYLHKYVDAVSHNSEMLAALISDLAVLSSGNITLSCRTVNIGKLCKQAVSSAEHLVVPDVTLTLAPNPQTVKINTDPHRLTHILWQLLSNAAKFTTVGSITVSYKGLPDGHVSITVEDTGIGIPSTQTERIFEPFVKLDRTSQGPGIGLTIARTLGRRLGGDIVYTATETGSRFTILI